MKIIGERAELHRAGMPAYLAEVAVEDTSGDRPIVYYVNAIMHDFDHYGVSKESVFSSDEGEVEFIEEYENEEDAQSSAYSQYFEVVRRLIDDLG